MQSLRILITGSREWPDPDAVKRRIRWVAEVYGVPYNCVTVVHGDARGADMMADQAAKDLGMQVDPHPVPKAAWKISRRAGHDRNQHMVNLGADICLAFHLDNSDGTADCIRRAREAGIRVECLSLSSGGVYS